MKEMNQRMFLSKKVESHSSNSVKEMKVTFQERSLFGKNDSAWFCLKLWNVSSFFQFGYIRDDLQSLEQWQKKKKKKILTFTDH